MWLSPRRPISKVNATSTGARLLPLGFLIGIGIAVLYGTKANEWHKLALLRKGYRVL